MPKRKKTISPTEMEALKVLWKHGPQSYREVHGHFQKEGKTWATTTVQTLLQRLQAKGFVKSTLTNGTSIFRPSESKDRFLQHSLKTLSKDVCGGGAMPLVLNLIKGTNFTPEQVEQLQSLLEERQDGTTKRSPKKRSKKA